MCHVLPIVSLSLTVSHYHLQIVSFSKQSRMCLQDSYNYSLTEHVSRIYDLMQISKGPSESGAYVFTSSGVHQIRRSTT